MMKLFFPRALRSLAVPLSFLAAQLNPQIINAQDTSIPYNEIYEQLFEASPSEGSGMFLDVDQIGIDTFPGSNANGQTFTATIESIDELDITDPDFLGTLTPSQLSFYQGIDNLSWVYGAVWRNNSRIEFAGNVIERTTATGSSFELQPALYFDSIAQIYATQAADPCPSGSFIIPVHIPAFLPGCWHCWLEYLDALDQARADYVGAFLEAQLNLSNAAEALSEGSENALEGAMEQMNGAGRTIANDVGVAVLLANAVLNDFQMELATLNNQYTTALNAFFAAMTEAGEDLAAAQTEALTDLLECLEECSTPGTSATTIVLGYYHIIWDCYGSAEEWHDA